MPDDADAFALKARRWLDRAAKALEPLDHHWETGDIEVAASIGRGYADLAALARLEQNRAADLERIAEHRREDLERIAAADLAQRHAEAAVLDAHAAMKRLADVQIAAWSEQYPHLVDVLDAAAEVKSDA